MSFCSGIQDPDSEPLIPYEQALLHIEETARKAAEYLPLGGQKGLTTLDQDKKIVQRQHQTIVVKVPLVEAAGQLAAATICATRHTPEYDTSAMDGFAVCSRNTTQASEDRPVTFAIIDSIAAGDVQKSIRTWDCTENVCVEIMTGARFPESDFSSLDAVVKVEDVNVIDQWSTEYAKRRRYIQIRRPVKLRQNRRPAGSDFSIGDLIVKEGTLIEPKHVAALASLGILYVPIIKACETATISPVQEHQPREFQIGILSTGSEIVSGEKVKMQQQGQQIADSNGPYLMSALQMFVPRAKVKHLGIAADTETSLLDHLKTAIEAGYDMIVTSGGVSKGRYDLVRHVIERKLGGRIVFHGLAVRPGAPVLLATCDRANSDGVVSNKVTIFGAPGNPLAAAMTLRFLVLPYLNRISIETNVLDCPVSSIEVARVYQHNGGVLIGSRDDKRSSIIIRRKPKDVTAFWLARRCKEDNKHVEILFDQASYKLSALLLADCWVIAPDVHCEIYQGDILTACSL